jgi:hypothetical protein
MIPCAGWFAHFYNLSLPGGTSRRCAKLSRDTRSTAQQRWQKAFEAEVAAVEAEYRRLDERRARDGKYVPPPSAALVVKFSRSEKRAAPICGPPGQSPGASRRNRVIYSKAGKRVLVSRR